MESFLFWGGLLSLVLAALWVAWLFRIEVRILRKYEKRTPVVLHAPRSKD